MQGKWTKIVKTLALTPLPPGNQIDKNGFFIKKNSEGSGLGSYHQKNKLFSHIFYRFVQMRLSGLLFSSHYLDIDTGNLKHIFQTTLQV